MKHVLSQTFSVGEHCYRKGVIGGEGPMEAWQCCSEPIPSHTLILMLSPLSNTHPEGLTVHEREQIGLLSLFFFTESQNA